MALKFWYGGASHLEYAGGNVTGGMKHWKDGAPAIYPIGAPGGNLNKTIGITLTASGDVKIKGVFNKTIGIELTALGTNAAAGDVNGVLTKTIGITLAATGRVGSRRRNNVMIVT